MRWLFIITSDLNIVCVQDEVRALGRLPELNVPEAFITRHPFPGACTLFMVLVPYCCFNGQERRYIFRQQGFFAHASLGGLTCKQLAKVL